MLDTPTSEIPAAMLDAALKEMFNQALERDIDIDNDDQRELTTAILEAAGVPALLNDFQAIFDSLDLGDCPAEAFQEMKHTDQIAAICDSMKEQRKFLTHWHDQADRFFQQWKEAKARIAELESELAQFQTSKFHPDWSLLEAAQENLREAWARIRELESELETIARIGADDVPGSE